MERVDFIFAIVESVLYVIIALLALIYPFPILCIRRFQHWNHIFTLNVRVSTARFQGQSVSDAPGRRTISRRDIFLLRHMVILFCVFTVGWGPSMIADIVSYHTPVNPILYKYLTGLCLPRRRK
jgi:hypothetical protein